MKNIALSESVLIFSQLSLLLKSGIPLNKSLKILSARLPANLGRRILLVSADLEKGITFSSSMQKAGLITEETLHTFRVAEENAFLEEALARTAAWQERKEHFLQGFRRAMIYPAIVLTMSFLSLAAMIVFVLPQYAQMFTDNSFRLPLITRAVMLLPRFYFIGIILLAIGMLAFLRAFRDYDFRMNLPLFGKVYTGAVLRDICCALSYQLKSGVPFLHALRSINGGIGSRKIKLALKNVISGIEQGMSLQTAFAKEKLFNGLFLQLVAVGEETGELAKMLWQAGEQFGTEAEYSLKKITAYLEPAATLFVGGVVAIVALAMLLPLFSLVNSFI